MASPPDDRARTRSRQRFALSAAALAALAAMGCATAPQQRRDEPMSRGAIPASSAPRSGGRAAAIERVLSAARAAIGEPSEQSGCSAFVRSLYLRVDVDLFAEGRPSDNGVKAMVRTVRRRGLVHHRSIPQRGDLVFFDNSYDRNGDGKLNDPLTHVGIVDEVLADGTAMVIHASNHGVAREPLNLLRPHDPTVNAVLRRRSPRDTPRTPHLWSELFAGFGQVLPPAPGDSVQDAS